MGDAAVGMTQKCGEWFSVARGNGDQVCKWVHSRRRLPEEHSLVAVKVHPAVKVIFELQL